MASFRGQYAFLSNFYPAPVRLVFPANVGVDNAIYRTTEHAFCAAKTLDINWRIRIWQAPTPKVAKALGRKVPLRPDWEAIKLDVMLGVLRQKFAADSLKQQLLGTGDMHLVEGNEWHDNYWGSCTCPACGNHGENHLGRLLMQVRNEVRGP